VSAHQRARQLDPHIRTSVANTYMALQDFPRVLEPANDISPSQAALALFETGASLDAVMRGIDTEFGRFDQNSLPGLFASALRASVAGDRDAVLAICQKLRAVIQHHPDGEGVYTMTRMLARAGWREQALEALQITIDAGFFAASAFERDHWLEPIRDTEEYRRLLAKARERSLASDAAFQAAGGYRLLGLRPPSSPSR
jgi:hypothetical protein